MKATFFEQRTSRVRRLDVIVLLSWFVTSRIAGSRLGIDYNSVPLERLWQIVIPELLGAQPLESLWYLHGQPPLYNALVALAMQLPVDAAGVVHAVWVCVGFLLALALFVAMRLAGAPTPVCHAIVLAWGLNPTLLLYENFLLYSYMEAACVLGGLVALLLLGRTGDTRSAILYSLICSILPATRAMFQLPWAIGTAVAAMVPMRLIASPRRIAAAFVAPIVIVAVLTLKNGLMYDVWTTSSWYGMNVASFARAAVMGEMQLLAAEGVVSPAIVVGGFQAVEDYPLSLVEPEISRIRERHGHRALLELPRSSSGGVNYNHAAYIAVSRQLAADSRRLLPLRFHAMRRTAVAAWRQFLKPASQYAALDANRRLLASLDDAYTAVIYPRASSVLVASHLIFAVLSAAYFWAAGVAARDWLSPAAGYLVVTATWMTAAGVLGEYGENHRFRFAMDPMVFAWNGVVLTRVAHWWSSRRAGTRQLP